MLPLICFTQMQKDFRPCFAHGGSSDEKTQKKPLIFSRLIARKDYLVCTNQRWLARGAVLNRTRGIVINLASLCVEST